VTAAPLLAPPPSFRLTPARFWQHRTGGLLQLPSGDPEFDTRWTMLAADGSPRLRTEAQDPTLRGLLLAADHRDAFWVAPGRAPVCASETAPPRVPRAPGPPRGRERRLRERRVPRGRSAEDRHAPERLLR